MRKIVFFDNNKELISVYKKHLSDVSNTSFLISDFETLVRSIHINVLVSPSNSLGYFNGGIDKVYRKFFPDIEKIVQGEIKKLKCINDGRYFLPIGSAIAVDLRSKLCDYLIAAPTMYLPQNIQGTNNVYLAFMSILNCLDKAFGKNVDLLVACPGLGTGVGGLEFEESAKQIRNAFLDYGKKKEQLL